MTELPISSLAELRLEIDRIDAGMHALLMERGEIIRTLIAIKAGQGGGSAFRPAREAAMMRDLVERHRGVLPLDTVESIWRVIISTFTFVQAPYSVHVDVSRGDAAIRDSARFHFGFTVPCVAHRCAQEVIRAVAASTGDLGMFAFEGRAGGDAWWKQLESAEAPKVIARLPFVERPDHPAGMPVFVISKPLVDGLAREVVTESILVDRWRPEFVAALKAIGAEIVSSAGDDRGLALLVARPGHLGSEATAETLRVAGAGEVRSVEVGAHASRFSPRVVASSRDLGLIGATMTSVSPVRPQPRPEILEIDAYVPGKSHIAGVTKPHKLSSNETPLGPSANAVRAFRNSAERLELYPDGSAAPLREAIAHKYGLDATRIICGNGSDELLSLLAMVYLHPGDEGLYSEYGFLTYPICIRAAGAVPVVAKETSRTADVDAVLAQVSQRTKIVFIANPNNPTGTYLSFSEIKRLHAGLPPHCLLVIDAAYAEYVTRNDYSAGIELVSTCENVVMTRTFSKIHGLAGLRIGWAYAPSHVIDALNRVRGPFNVNGPAIEAGIASLADAAHIEKAIAHNTEWLPWLVQQISAHGIEVTPSVGNFLLLDFPKEPGRTAKDADAYLSQRGFILRAVAAYGLPNCLRMTVGTEEANRGVVAALSDFMRGGHG